ncbi:MAG: tyrosine-type recombinase/integrase [Acidobacteria bacterium]|nr:tyrosine-type recombinase/integrase [Acidobacteriota bacterium]
MEKIKSSHQLELLSGLGPKSRDQVMAYLQRQQARNCVPKTLMNVVYAIRRVDRYFPDDRRALVMDDLTQTTASDLDRWVHNAQQHGLAPGTINGTLKVLTKLFAFLIDQGQMTSQVVKRHRHRVLEPRTLPKPMAETDVVSFFKGIDSVGHRLLFLLMLRCGLRVSEACTLTWAQIDFEAGTIRIDQGKGRVDRIVYLAPDVQDTLTVWRAHQSTHGYLFPSDIKPSAPLTPRTAQRWMAQYLQRASITGRYTPHCLRHTFATQLLNAGLPLEVLKELMGHDSIQMTLRYAQLYESTKRRQYNQAMERIEHRQAMGGR